MAMPAFQARPGLLKEAGSLIKLAQACPSKIQASPEAYTRSNLRGCSLCEEAPDPALSMCCLALGLGAWKRTTAGIFPLAWPKFLSPKSRLWDCLDLSLGALKKHSCWGLLLGVAQVLRQPGQRPVVCRGQVPVEYICDLLHTAYLCR